MKRIKLKKKVDRKLAQTKMKKFYTAVATWFQNTKTLCFW